MFDRRLDQTNWELLSFIQSVWLTASASTLHQFIKITVVASRGGSLILFFLKIIVVASRGSSLIFLLFTAFQLGLILVIGGGHLYDLKSDAVLMLLMATFLSHLIIIRTNWRRHTFDFVGRSFIQLLTDRFLFRAASERFMMLHSGCT